MTTITQLSQSTSLDGSEKYAIDNSFGTFNTTLTSMSVFIENLAGSYPFTMTVEDGDRIKMVKSDGVYSFQPGTSIFKDVSSGSDALSTQIVVGSDTRLSDARYPTFHSHSINDTFLLQSELDKRVRTSSMGVPYGVASLDALGKVPTSQLPSSLSGQVSYIGTWNATSNSPLLSNTTGVNQASLVKGNYYVVSVAGSTDFGAGAIQFSVGDWAISNGVVWQKVNNKEYISSVAGKSGSAVTLLATDISNAIGTNFNSTLIPGNHITDSTPPTSSGHLANKDYVDTKLSLSGGSMTGSLYITSTSQLQIGAVDRYFSSSLDSISIRKAGNTNITVYDNGNVYIRSKLSVSGSLQTAGTVTVGGTSGSDGVRFPDGTLQTTAVNSSGVIWLPSGIALGTTNNNTFTQTLLPSIPITAKGVIIQVSQDRITSNNGTTTQVYFSPDLSVTFTAMLHFSNDGNSNGGYAGQGTYPIFVNAGQSYIYIRHTRTGSFGAPVIRLLGYVT